MGTKTRQLSLLKIFLIICAFILADLTLNVTLYNPTFITPVYDFVLSHRLISSEESGYPLVNVQKLNWGLYTGPRAAVIGIVEEVLKSNDGDLHINIKNNSGTVVTEIIPEYPLPAPFVGEKIRIWGITRYDIAHRWWELHPVIGWREIDNI